MKRYLTLTLAMALLLGAVLVPSASMAYTTKYVYTDNGKSLNIRTDPWVGDNVIGQVPYGSEVVVDYNLGNGWTALMGAGSWPDTVYCQTRFLVNSKPAAKNSGSSGSSNTGSASQTNSTVTELNKIFKSYKKVAPYTITVRPVRASGWVNLRFAPSKKCEVLATYGANANLTVIAEFTDWYQVTDPNTGVVGYINSAFVSR